MAETANFVPAFVSLLVLLAGVIGYLAWRSRCPRCGRVFARRFVRKEVTKRSLLVFATQERHFYTCKHCSHSWDRLVDVNND